MGPEFWAPIQLFFYWWNEYWVHRLLFVVLVWILGRLDADTTSLCCSYNSDLDLNTGFHDLLLGRLVSTSFWWTEYCILKPTSLCGFYKMLGESTSLCRTCWRSGYWFLIHTGQTGCRYDFSISFLQLWSEYWTLYWIRLDARLWHSLKICSVKLKILSSMLVHTLVSLCPGWLLLCRPPNYWSEVTLRVDEGVWNFCYQFPPFRAV